MQGILDKIPILGDGIHNWIGEQYTITNRYNNKKF